MRRCSAADYYRARGPTIAAYACAAPCVRPNIQAVNTARVKAILAQLDGLAAEATSAREALQEELQRAVDRRDPLAAHIYRARQDFRAALARDGKAARASTTTCLTSYQKALSLGYPGRIETWRALLAC